MKPRNHTEMSLYLAIQDLDKDDNFKHTETEMHSLLGERYNDYRLEVTTKRVVPYDLLTTSGRDWANRMDALLGEVQSSLNFGHISTQTSNLGKSGRLVADFKTRVEHLLEEFGENIARTPDEQHFSVQDNWDDKYLNAQRLIEEWQIPRVSKPHNAGLSDLDHHRMAQRNHLQAYFDHLNPPAPEAPTAQTNTALLDRMKKFSGHS